MANSTAPSATPTVVDGASNASRESLNEEIGRELFPGPEEKKKDPFLVEFDEVDPENPKVGGYLPLTRSSRRLPSPVQTWSEAYRWYLTMLGGLLVLNAYVPLGSPTHLTAYLTCSCTAPLRHRHRLASFLNSSRNST